MFFGISNFLTPTRRPIVTLTAHTHTPTLGSLRNGGPARAWHAYRQPARRVPREPLSGLAHGRVVPGPISSGRVVVVGAATRLRSGRAGPHAVHVRRRRAAEHEPSAGRPAAGRDVREQRFRRRPVGVHRPAADEHGPQLEPAPDVGPFGLAQPHVVAGHRNAETTRMSPSRGCAYKGGAHGEHRLPWPPRPTTQWRRIDTVQIIGLRELLPARPPPSSEIRFGQFQNSPKLNRTPIENRVLRKFVFSDYDYVRLSGQTISPRPPNAILLWTPRI